LRLARIAIRFHLTRFDHAKNKTMQPQHSETSRHFLQHSSVEACECSPG
jgi:hypothetical protein